MIQHGNTPERWSRFDLGQQILQIGVELQRALKFLRVDRSMQLRACYERALDLLRLTVEVQPDPELRRELEAFGGAIAELHGKPEPDPIAHRRTLRGILQLHPESAKQIPLLGL
jgi:hypothetical protein